MPTELERARRFLADLRQQLASSSSSATRSCQATATSLTGGPACFPGNIIPPDRINPTAQALLNLFPPPNATVRPATNQYNYTFQTVQDWPRNDQVLRMDWNVAQNTTMYGRLQFGYEKRAGGVSFLGSTAAAGRSSRASTEIDTVSYVNTLLHTFSPTLFSEVTVGVNWSHQYTSALDAGGARRQRPDDRAAGFPQFFPQANPDNLLPQATFGGGTPGTIALVQRRQPLAVLRLQHAVELLRQPHEDQGRAQHQDRPVRRAHDAPGAARRRPSTAR